MYMIYLLTEIRAQCNIKHVCRYTTYYNIPMHCTTTIIIIIKSIMLYKCKLYIMCDIKMPHKISCVFRYHIFSSFDVTMAYINYARVYVVYISIFISIYIKLASNIVCICFVIYVVCCTNW